MCFKSWQLNCGVGEDSWEFLGLQGDSTNPFWRMFFVLGVHWKDWCWSWNCNTLATWCEELTHWKRLWCWEGLGAGGEGDNGGWDDWMASLTRWMWVWVNSRRWWWTGSPGVLQFSGSQRVRHDWVTELNWTELKVKFDPPINWWCCWGNRTVTKEVSSYQGRKRRKKVVSQRTGIEWPEVLGLLGAYTTT